MRPTTLERAFELAETGGYMTTLALGKALKAEGYLGVDSLLAQEPVGKRLRAAIVEARLAGAGALIEDASVGLDAVGFAARPDRPAMASAQAG